jgi:hypothetical protein
MCVFTCLAKKIHLSTFPYEDVIFCWKDLKIRDQANWYNSFKIDIFNKKNYVHFCNYKFEQP